MSAKPKKNPFRSLRHHPDIRVGVDDASARNILTAGLQSYVASADGAGNLMTVVCVGSDRSTGDSLGPLVGSKLHRLGHPRLRVYGTLDEPVHAANLNEQIHMIQSDPANRFILAIDACLGKAENVGTICIKPGPLRPGTGVKKELPQVGHFHMIGVVNVGGFMEYFVLQNTRLSLVMRLANLITHSIFDALSTDSLPKLQQPVAATWDP